MEMTSYAIPTDGDAWAVATEATRTAFDWDYAGSRDRLAALYQKGKDGQWDAQARIDWSREIDPDNPLGVPDAFVAVSGAPVWAKLSASEKGLVRRHAAAWSFSQFLHGEQGALVCSAKIVQTVPDLDAKFYAGTQVMDEARHVEAYSRYLREKLDLAYPINPPLATLLDQVIRDSRWDITYLGMQILIEGLALGAFAGIRDIATEPTARELTAYVMQDEARHVAFGRLSLRDYYPQLSDAERAEREEFAVEALYFMRDRFNNAEVWERLGLPAGPFQSVAFFAPTRKGTVTPMPDTGSRQEGVQPYVWTMREFCRERLLRFVFVDGDDARAQIHLVITRVEQALERAARDGDQTAASVHLEGITVDSFSELVEQLDGPVLDLMMRGAPVAEGTKDAFRRRLHAAAERMGHLVSGHSEARGRAIDWSAQQVTVVDIHSLHASAQLFVVGVLLKRMMDQKEQQGGSRPLVFVVLDELNKYAPRDGWSPLHGLLLDIAERGRSLGVSLFGAQQTASEVERRIVGNAALKVVGRLDAAESERSEYGFLTRVGRVRATLLRPGSMIVGQPEIPMAILLRFPFPAWATRASEVATSAAGGADPFARMF